MPARTRWRAASASPCAPSACLCPIPDLLPPPWRRGRTGRSGSVRTCGRRTVAAALWTETGSSAGGSGLERVDLRRRELLDVDVLEREHLDVLREARRSV